MELTEQQWMIVKTGREALRETVAANYPGDSSLVRGIPPSPSRFRQRRPW